MNRRVRTLRTRLYKEGGTKETKAGFKAPRYQPTPKAYLAIILNQTSLEDFVEQADEAEILAALGIFSEVL